MANKLLIVGGAGALGRGVVSRFARASWGVTSVGFTPNDEADNVILKERNSLQDAHDVLKEVSSRHGKVNTVVCTAGGWAGGSIRDLDSLVNLGEMHAKNTESAFLATYLASHLLAPGGLLVLTGATAALKATPGMVSYGVTKAATHHLVASAVSELPQDASVLAILPSTIDTPMNRKFMADADFSTWTKAEDIADKILEWSQSASARPPSGHLVTATTVNNTTSWEDIGNPFQ